MMGVLFVISVLLLLELLEVVIEDLTDIRETFIKREKEHTPKERRVLHSWPSESSKG